MGTYGGTRNYWQIEEEKIGATVRSNPYHAIEGEWNVKNAIAVVRFNLIFLLEFSELRIAGGPSIQTRQFRVFIFGGRSGIHFGRHFKMGRQFCEEITSCWNIEGGYWTCHVRRQGKRRMFIYFIFLGRGRRGVGFSSSTFPQHK